MGKENEVVIERMIDAPRQMVFDAFTDAEQLKQWYAPNGCHISYCKIDFRVGGVFHHCITTEHGDCWCKGVYHEIIEPEKLVYSLLFSDKEGTSVDSSPVGKHPDWPLETVVTITLHEINGKTKLTLHQTVSEALAKETGAYPSWLQMLDKLEETIKTPVWNRR